MILLQCTHSHESGHQASTQASCLTSIRVLSQGETHWTCTQAICPTSLEVKHIPRKFPNFSQEWLLNKYPDKLSDFSQECCLIGNTHWAHAQAICLISLRLAIENKLGKVDWLLPRVIIQQVPRKGVWLLLRVVIKHILGQDVWPLLRVVSHG